MRLIERRSTRLAVLLVVVMMLAAVGAANWVSFPYDTF
jgi:hypothetical protein